MVSFTFFCIEFHQAFYNPVIQSCKVSSTFPLAICFSTLTQPESLFTLLFVPFPIVQEQSEEQG